MNREQLLEFTNDDEVFSKKTIFGNKKYLFGSINRIIDDDTYWVRKAIEKAYSWGLRDHKIEAEISGINFRKQVCCCGHERRWHFNDKEGASVLVTLKRAEKERYFFGCDIIKCKCKKFEVKE